MSATVSDADDGDVALRWSLNPAQWEFVHSRARFSLYIGGIGAGKTFAGAARATLRALEDGGSLGLVGAPTWAMLRDTTQRALFELLPRQAIRHYYRSERRVALRNGSEILLRSLDQPDFARGLNLAWFWLDEAPLCGYYAWEVLKGRLRQPGHATAAWATGTPQGRDGFARDFELAPRRRHALYRASTWSNAHNLPPDFVADLGYTGAFEQQEVYGLFVAFEGLVYTLDASVGGHIAEWEGTAFRRVIGGIDWGYTNPAVALVIGLDADQRAWQVEEFYQRRASLEDTIIPTIIAMTLRHGVQVWYADSEDPEAIDRLNAALAHAGLRSRAQGVRKGSGSVRAGIQTVTAALARRGDGTRGLYVSPRCVHTIAEFGSYAYASASSGSAATAQRDPAEEPIKLNDHCLDALRYALHSELSQRRSVSQTDLWLADLTRRGG